MYIYISTFYTHNIHMYSIIYAHLGLSSVTAQGLSAVQDPPDDGSRPTLLKRRWSGHWWVA